MPYLLESGAGRLLAEDGSVLLLESDSSSSIVSASGTIAATSALAGAARRTLRASGTIAATSSLSLGLNRVSVSGTIAAHSTWSNSPYVIVVGGTIAAHGAIEATSWSLRWPVVVDTIGAGVAPSRHVFITLQMDLGAGLVVIPNSMIGNGMAFNESFDNIVDELQFTLVGRQFSPLQNLALTGKRRVVLSLSYGGPGAILAAPVFEGVLWQANFNGETCACIVHDDASKHVEKRVAIDVQPNSGRSRLEIARAQLDAHGVPVSGIDLYPADGGNVAKPVSFTDVRLFDFMQNFLSPVDAIMWFERGMLRVSSVAKLMNQSPIDIGRNMISKPISVVAPPSSAVNTVIAASVKFSSVEPSGTRTVVSVVITRAMYDPMIGVLRGAPGSGSYTYHGPSEPEKIVSRVTTTDTYFGDVIIRSQVDEEAWYARQAARLQISRRTAAPLNVDTTAGAGGPDDAVISVTSIGDWPPSGRFTIWGTGEVVAYSGVSGLTLTGCSRGLNGTTPGAVFGTLVFLGYPGEIITERPGSWFAYPDGSFRADPEETFRLVRRTVTTRDLYSTFYYNEQIPQVVDIAGHGRTEHYPELENYVVRETVNRYYYHFLQQALYEIYDGSEVLFYGGQYPITEGGAGVLRGYEMMGDETYDYQTTPGPDSQTVTDWVYYRPSHLVPGVGGWDYTLDGPPDGTLWSERVTVRDYSLGADRGRQPGAYGYGTGSRVYKSLAEETFGAAKTTVETKYAAVNESAYSVSAATAVTAGGTPVLGSSQVVSSTGVGAIPHGQRVGNTNASQEISARVEYSLGVTLNGEILDPLHNEFIETVEEAHTVALARVRDQSAITATIDQPIEGLLHKGHVIRPYLPEFGANVPMLVWSITRNLGSFRQTVIARKFLPGTI